VAIPVKSSAKREKMSIDNVAAAHSQQEFAELTGGPDDKPPCKWDDDLIAAGVMVFLAVLIYIVSPIGEGWWLP
jgi:hypothetical protein